MKTKKAEMTYDLTFTEDELVTLRAALRYCTTVPIKTQRSIFGDKGSVDRAFNINEDIYCLLFERKYD